MATVSERFLRYVAFDTMSDEFSETCPSTEKQLALGKALVEEMLSMGIADAHMDENGYIYGTVPGDPSLPTIGLIAHMDTSPSCSGANIKAQTILYNGGDILLNEEKQIYMCESDFESLANNVGKHLIVTDGTTLLGADDKAGIAEILTAAQMLMESKQPHATLRIGITPDEEIGRGADLFDVEGFKADYAYTVDGGALGELEYENFNAAGMRVVVHGVNIHPGSAKNQMKNAALIAMEWNSLLPPAEIPAHTEGYEGFFHLCQMEGNEELASLIYIIRDHDAAKFDRRKQQVQEITDFLNARYGEGTVELQLRDSYRNMREMIEPHMHIIGKAKAAFEACGVKPLTTPIRGGTDGANLSFMGLPCPNIFAGGHNFHGKMEYVPLESMEKASKVILNIISLYAQQ